VRAHSIHKTYQESKASEPTLALRGISVDFEPGTMTALMGPSGSGKSTLLYCLAGLEEPTSGTSHILDRDVASMSKRDAAIFRRDHVGFVFQAYNLIPSIDVYENVALPARLAGRPVDDAVIRRTLDEIGLGAKLHTMPGRLSGGQQQRVAIARALISKPTVMFADEPTGNLDSRTSGEILELLRNSVTSYGQTTVMVTHDAHAAAIADRILFLADGLIVKDLGPSSSHEILDALEEVTAR
jgi:putative ABC transport system ATP-binding protein